MPPIERGATFPGIRAHTIRPLALRGRSVRMLAFPRPQPRRVRMNLTPTDEVTILRFPRQVYTGEPGQAPGAVPTGMSFAVGKVIRVNYNFGILENYIY